MSDKELLELAARAVGMQGCAAEIIVPKKTVFFVDGESTEWDPLTDDGDALRLAVKLNIQVSSNYNGMSQALWNSNTPSGFSVVNEAHENDPDAATRMAIVRAAAEIGKTL